MSTITNNNYALTVLRDVRSLGRTEIREKRRYFVAGEYRRLKRSSGNLVKDGYKLVESAARRYWRSTGAANQSAEHRGGIVPRHCISKTSYLSETYPRLGANYLLGIELELELPDLEEGESASDPVVVELVRCGLGRQVALTSDGSLSNGVEVVFFPRTIAEIRERKQEIMRLFDSLRESGYTSQSGGLIGNGIKGNAGVHVHVSRQVLSDYAWERLQCLMCAPKLSKILQGISGRACPDNTYCSYQGSLPDTYSRYKCLNLSTSDTREFRLFGGTLDYYRLIGYLETVRVLVDAMRLDQTIKEVDLIVLLGRNGWIRRLNPDLAWDMSALLERERLEREQNAETWRRFERRLRDAVWNLPEIVRAREGQHLLVNCTIWVDRDSVTERLWKAIKQEASWLIKSARGETVSFVLPQSRRLRGFPGENDRAGGGLNVAIKSMSSGDTRICLERVVY